MPCENYSVMRTRPLLVVCRFLLLAIASSLLYYGLVMLFLVPGNPGGPYWEKPRVVLGLVPLLLGIAMLVVSAWIASLYRSHARGNVITQTMVYAAVGIVLVFAALAVNDLYVHFPIHIR